MASSSTSNPHPTEDPVAPTLCYVCGGAIVESIVVKKEGSLNIGKWYYRCPRSRIRDDTRCPLDIEWHEKYKRTLEAFRLIRAQQEVEEAQSANRNAAAAGDLRRGRGSRADPCARLLMLAALFVSIGQLVIELAIYGNI